MCTDENHRIIEAIKLVSGCCYLMCTVFFFFFCALRRVLWHTGIKIVGTIPKRGNKRGEEIITFHETTALHAISVTKENKGFWRS
uniref:Uncharacterized protein n=1 Tax=Rhizophora mucronata TaxID=61149 RepID=A0A2P2JW15_RHIMU